MSFFGKKTDDARAVDKVYQWLIDVAENVPESLGDTSIARLSRKASAELNMPQGTALRAIYDLRDGKKIVRVDGNVRNGAFKVKRNIPQAEKAEPTTGCKIKKIIVDDAKDAQKEPTKVDVKKDGREITITIKIEF